MNYFNHMHEYLDKKDPLECVPVCKKAPFIKEWQSIKVTADVINAWEEIYTGVADGFGVRAGQHNIGWMDVDTNDSILIHKIDEIMDLSNICVKKGMKGKTVFFRHNGRPLKSKYNVYLKGDNKKPVVEFNFTSGQTVLPPSIHPQTGAPYVWVSNSLLDIDIEDLPFIDEGKIEYLETILNAASLEEGLKQVPTSVTGDGSGKFNTMKSEVTRLLHLGIDDSSIAKTLVGLDRRLFPGNQFFFSSKLGKDLISKDSDIDNALMWVNTYKNSLMRTDPDLRRTLSSIAKVSDAVQVHGDWQIPIPLVSKKRIIEFPDHLFPSAFKDYCKDLSRQSALPAESYLMALFSSLSACCQAKVSIHAKPDFIVHPSISTMIVAPSGSRKDAVFDAALAPLRKITDAMMDNITAEFIENEKSVVAEIVELSKKKQKAISEKDYPSRDSLSAEIVELQNQLTEIKAERPNFIFESGTQEKLYELMYQNQDRGIFLTSSEYVHLMGGLSKKGNESLRGFYLKLLNGSTTETFSHQTKGGTNVNIRKVVGCALVGAQTDILAQDIREMEAGRQSDGLLQRFFLIAVNPEIRRMEKSRKVVDSNRIDNLFNLLFHHKNKIDVVWENDEAEDAYLDYDFHLRKKIEFEKSVIKSFRSKYSGKSVQLAWIIELGNSRPGVIPTTISKKSFLIAVELLEWLSVNLDLIWDNSNYSAALRSAELMLMSIKAGGVKASNFQTDIIKNTRLTMIDFNLGCNLLVDNHYIRQTGDKYEMSPML
jgi:hypothetical protein